MGNNKMVKKDKKDFSTRRQVDKIVSSVPDVKREAKKFTELDGGEL